MPIRKLRPSKSPKLHGKRTAGFGGNTQNLIPRALAFIAAAGLGICLLSSCDAPTVATSHASGGNAARSGSSSSGYSCVTTYIPRRASGCPSDAGYRDHPQITGIGNINYNGNDPVINQDVWSGDSNYRSTLYANSPSDWKVVVNSSNTSGGGVLAYPDVGWFPYPAETPIDSYSSITSSWNVTIPTDTSTTAGWAGYDLWFNGPWGNSPDEVMIQPDITANSNYVCTPVATATFNGMPWHLCVIGSGAHPERVWKPGTDDQHLINQTSGTIDVLAMLKWMGQNKNPRTGAPWLAPGSKWFAASFGFEICDTHGITQTFHVNGFTWHQELR